MGVTRSHAFVRRARLWVCLLVVGALVLGEAGVVSASASEEQPSEAVSAAELSGLPSDEPTVTALDQSDGRFDLPSPPTASEPALKPEHYDTSQAKPVRELAGRRGASSEVWQNDNGTFTQYVFDAPKYFQAGPGGAWELIDNTLVPVPGREGWVQNTANAWAVRFGPIGPGGSGGVEVVSNGQTMRFAPQMAANKPMAPTVEGDTVTYSEIGKGVDLRYTVKGDGVKEDIVLRAQPESPTVDFVVEGATLTPDEKTDGAFKVDGGAVDVAVGAPELADKSGRPIGGHVDSSSATDPKTGVTMLQVSIDPTC